MPDETEQDMAPDAREAAMDAPPTGETAESPPEPTGDAQPVAESEATPADEPSDEGTPADAADEGAVEAEPTTDEADEAEDAEDAEEAEDDIEVAFEVTDVGPCRKKIAVTVGRDVFDAEMDKQFTELGQTVVTPGFRKGRAPRWILERRYGKALTDQVKQSLAARGVEKALTEADLTPVGEPEIGEIELADGGPLTVDATMDVRPAVDLKEYTGLAITKRAVSVGEKEIDATLRSLLERRGRLVPVVDPEAVVARTDLVVCDYRLTCGEETLAERADITVPMQLMRWPDIPELDTDRLLGAKAESTVETRFELTDERWPEGHRGREAALSVTVHEIKRIELPDLTAEVLADFGAESENDLRAQIEIALLRDLEGEVQREVEEQLQRQLLEQATFELPASLVAEHAVRGATRTRLRLMELGIPQEEIDKRAEDLAETSRERAERDLKMFFIFEHIADREDIEVEPRDIEERIARIAERHDVSPRQARLWLEKDGALDSLDRMIREQKTIEWLIEHATVTELEPDVDVAVAAPDGT